jgi:hypothetical protein
MSMVLFHRHLLVNRLSNLREFPFDKSASFLDFLARKKVLKFKVRFSSPIFGRFSSKSTFSSTILTDMSIFFSAFLLSLLTLVRSATLLWPNVIKLFGFYFNVWNDKLARYIHSSLLQKSVNYSRNKFYDTGPRAIFSVT